MVQQEHRKTENLVDVTFTSDPEPAMNDLTTLRTLAEKATKGPWSADGVEWPDSSGFRGKDIRGADGRLVGWMLGEDNAAYAAALVNAAPALLAVADAAKAMSEHYADDGAPPHMRKVWRYEHENLCAALARVEEVK